MAKRENKDLQQYVGKRILAGHEPIFQFSTGQCVGRKRRRYIGTITGIGQGLVHVHDETNPEGYQDYDLEQPDFEKWVGEGVYLLKTSNSKI